MLSASLSIVFKVLTINVAMLTMFLRPSNFILVYVADFLNTMANVSNFLPN